MYTVGIVGLGYVGLALAKVLCERGKIVAGYDINEKRISQMRDGLSPNESIANELLRKFVSEQTLLLSSSPVILEKCSVIVICVPTPLSQNGKPDLALLQSACVEISKHISPGTLVINESTSHPGTLRDIVAPIISKDSTNSSYDFGCSPERVNPGDSSFELINTPRVVSGLTKAAISRTRDFYSIFANEVIEVETPEIAEMSKLLENSYRLVNIAFINELSDYCMSRGIPLRQVISAASSKPFGFSPFYPSLGIGGHCIPVDPEYLLEDALRSSADLGVLQRALVSNKQRSGKIASFLEKQVGKLSEKQVLLVGITYKANIADVRETPAAVLVKSLELAGAYVEWFDPLVESWEFAARGELEIGRYDLVVVSSLHDVINKELLLNLQIPIFDFSGKLPKSNLVVSI